MLSPFFLKRSKIVNKTVFIKYNFCSFNIVQWLHELCSFKSHICKDNIRTIRLETQNFTWGPDLRVERKDTHRLAPPLPETLKDQPVMDTSLILHDCVSECSCMYSANVDWEWHLNTLGQWSRSSFWSNNQFMCQIWRFKYNLFSSKHTHLVSIHFACWYVACSCTLV